MVVTGTCNAVVTSSNTKATKDRSNVDGSMKNNRHEGHGNSKNDTKMTSENVTAPIPVDIVDGCYVCHLNNNQDQILLCERCNGEYHTYCLQPPLVSVPELDWYCGTFILFFS
jgi:PHD-finger